MGDTYSYSINASTVSSGKNHLHVWNASGSGKIIKVTNVQLWNRPTGIVTGINIIIEGYRTQAAGSGGTPITVDKNDTLQPNLPAQITGNTGMIGATVDGKPLFAGNVYTEEGANQMPMLPIYNNEGDTKRRQVIIRENQGISLLQGPYGTVGIIGMKIEFVVEQYGV